MSMSKSLPNIKNNFSDWYNEVIYASELADQSPVRGCIVIRPYGYSLWENVKNILDEKIKKTGHLNALFPLFIPLSFLEKEAEHVAGFSPELAVVTHAGGKKLEEPLVVRPTSETMIHYMFAQWIHSWRDLPLKINQWANVVRWELRTRPFLRTSEFFWQEGHTAHETAEEAHEEATLMLAEYIDLAEHYLAIPVISGKKTAQEKFSGAEVTFTFETLMQDGKALQMGTSHLISQSFAHAFNMKYQDRNGELAYPYLTSWGVTTRLIGALVMVHGDQKGLVLPPKVAPIQVVIIPIYKKGSNKQELDAMIHEIYTRLKPILRVHVDDDDNTPGTKFYEWELKGVPLRVEIGPKDMRTHTAVVVDRLGIVKESIPFIALETVLAEKLELLQKTLFDRAQNRLHTMRHVRTKLDEFAQELEEHGGFYQTGWCGNNACEKLLKKHKATIRCIIREQQLSSCFNCDKASNADVLIAKSY